MTRVSGIIVGLLAALLYSIFMIGCELLAVESTSAIIFSVVELIAVGLVIGYIVWSIFDIRKFGGAFVIGFLTPFIPNVFAIAANMLSISMTSFLIMFLDNLIIGGFLGIASYVIMKYILR